VADPVTSLQVREDFNFFRRPPRIRPFFGYQAGSGVALKADWSGKGYSPTAIRKATQSFQKPGETSWERNKRDIPDGFGIFLQFAGLFHAIVDEKRLRILGN